MGTITGQQLLDRAGILTNDVAHVRFTAAEALLWLNDGQRQIVILRPDASTSSALTGLIGGSKQSIPPQHLRFVDIPRNSAGRAVRQIDRGELDRLDPDWHNSPPGPTRHFTFDARDPERFYVWPPAVAAATVELVTVVSPADLDSLTSAITLDDIFAGPLLDYVLYRMFSKNGKGADAGKAAGYLQTMASALGAKLQMDGALTPTTAGTQK